MHRVMLVCMESLWYVWSHIDMYGVTLICMESH